MMVAADGSAGDSLAAWCWRIAAAYQPRGRRIEKGDGWVTGELSPPYVSYVACMPTRPNWPLWLRPARGCRIELWAWPIAGNDLGHPDGASFWPTRAARRPFKGRGGSGWAIRGAGEDALNGPHCTW
jgi:hypothetical protein